MPRSARPIATGPSPAVSGSSGFPRRTGSPRSSRKVFTRLDAGTRAVLVLDTLPGAPQRYRGRGDVRGYVRADTVDLADAVPGCKLALPELFGRSRPPRDCRGVDPQADHRGSSCPVAGDVWTPDLLTGERTHHSRKESRRFASCPLERSAVVGGLDLLIGPSATARMCATGPMMGRDALRDTRVAPEDNLGVSDRAVRVDRTHPGDQCSFLRRGEQLRRPVATGERCERAGFAGPYPRRRMQHPLLPQPPGRHRAGVPAVLLGDRPDRTWKPT